MPKKGYKQTDEHKNKLAKTRIENPPMKGKFHSTRTKQKLSEITKGRIPWNKGKTKVYSYETIEKFRECRKGKKLSPETKKKISFSSLGRTHSEETKIKIGTSHKGKFISEETRKKQSLSKSGTNNPNYGNKWDKNRKENMSKIIRELKTLSLIELRNIHPFFFVVEEVRYNPDKLEEKEIQVHCKNHNCPNSKEQGGWFTPDRSKIFERARQLEKEYGNDGAYFYCSDKCKNECPLYRLNNDPLQNNERFYTNEEYQTFREFVLERDNNICQYCGKQAEHVHHERPQKLEPFFMFDPDYAWSVCKECHFKYGHKDECSTGKLASIICL